MSVTDNLKGFSVTFRHLFRKPVTQQYPEYKRPVYPRFRGRHRLHRHENGLEKCVGCALCAAACPAACIPVVDAITLGNDYELAEMSRDALVYTKQMLLEPSPEPRRTPVAPVDPYDVPAQEPA
jgi:NADH-quinone oxidoreductase subunit I